VLFSPFCATVTALNRQVVDAYCGGIKNILAAVERSVDYQSQSETETESQSRMETEHRHTRRRSVPRNPQQEHERDSLENVNNDVRLPSQRWHIGCKPARKHRVKQIEVQRQHVLCEQQGSEES